MCLVNPYQSNIDKSFVSMEHVALVHDSRNHFLYETKRITNNVSNSKLLGSADPRRSEPFPTQSKAAI